LIATTREVQGLLELAARTGVTPGSDPATLASAIDFVLEGLYAQKKISRSDERGYSAAETTARRPTRREEQAINEEVRIPSGKKKYYN
jgi:magnesium chelatase subunit I